MNEGDGVRLAGKRHWLALAAVLFLAASVNTANAECLSRSTVKPDGTTAKMTVLAPRGEIRKYEALGYSVDVCTATAQQLRQYAELLCRAETHQQNALRQSPVPQATGTLGGLCGSARAAIAEMDASRR
jgi:hypothetical protein